ncbi:helix-turn-helix transcriptional regulator [Lacrimispora sp. 38-1]|uniref:helix-turn-helix transcriptional regulator n=1 Tax=Lacrimispora sp. 38-1 TaxID=3125778 RepID=UPI003CE7EB02
MYDIFEKLLQKHGVTTYQVSKATGITQSTFSNWKSRRNLISSENGKKIADYFKVPIDYLMGNRFIEEMGHIIQEERIQQGLSQEELANVANIPIDDLKSYEEDDKPVREDIFDDIASTLGTSYLELLYKYDLYDEYIPPYFNGDVLQYEAFKKARDIDAMAEHSEDEDVLLISRLAKNMKPENRKKLIDMAKIMFAEDFDD